MSFDADMHCSGIAVQIILIKTAVAAFIFGQGEVLAEVVGNPAHY